MENELLVRLTKRRKRAAEMIGTLRAVRKDGARVVPNELIRIHLKMSSLGGLMRPTVAALTAEAEENEEFAASPVRPQGNEYWSACGAEDGMYEAREHAGEYAVELRAAAFDLRRTGPMPR